MRRKAGVGAIGPRGTDHEDLDCTVWLIAVGARYGRDDGVFP